MAEVIAHVLEEPWEKCVSKKVSKVRGCRSMQDMYVFL